MERAVAFGRVRAGFLLLLVAAIVAGASLTSAAGTAPGAVPLYEFEDGPETHAYTPHPPILIHGDRDFTGANGVTHGSGTPSDPYVIEGWEIDASNATGISIVDTLAHVVVRNVSVSRGDVIYDGVFLYNVSNAVIEGGMFVGNGYGIVAYESSTVTIANNLVESSLWEGILVESSSSVTVRANVVRFNAAYGIDVYMSTDVTVRENDASFGGFAGIYALTVDRVSIADNNASSNGALGIVLDFADNVTLSGNELWENEYGLDVLDSRDLIVRGNTIGVSLEAVSMAHVDNATLELNLFTSNEGGVFASYATDLTIAQNNFVGNLWQGWDDSGNRTAWDRGYPTGGNFWSDYAGVDLCSGPGQDDCTGPDGIGDAPYVIDPDTVDRYPLMTPIERVRGVEPGPALDPTAPPIFTRPPIPIPGVGSVLQTGPPPKMGEAADPPMLRTGSGEPAGPRSPIPSALVSSLSDGALRQQPSRGDAGL